MRASLPRPATILKSAAIAALLLTVASAATIVVYRDTVAYGFDYDDYHFVRPFSASEVAAAWHGRWDPSGIEVPFFRPLTVAFFAARFEWFGLNARAYHVTSLALFALAAALAGALVWRLTGRAIGGALTTLFFAVHPSMAYALAVWITNQMHLMELVVILLTLHAWYSVRARSFVWWIPLLAGGAAAFLIKEDGVMLLPAVVALHWWRRRLVEPALRPVPRLFLVSVVVLLAGLLALRFNALQAVAGYDRPTLARGWSNFLRGLNGVFLLVPADRAWQVTACWFATLLPVAALVVASRASRAARYGLAAGVTIAVCFELPFVFVVKPEQMHAIAFGAAIVLGASCVMLIEAARRQLVRAVLLLVFIGGATVFAAVTRDISLDFAPFGPIVLYHDSIVKDWAAVPYELRQYLEQKALPGAERTLPTNPTDAVQIVAFGTHSFETNPQGVSYRWMSGRRTEIQVAAAARELTIPLRHEAGAFREPARVEVEADGRLVDTLLLTDGTWRMSRIALRPGGVPRFSRMHRVVISIDHAWIPASIIPGSTDNRVLGLQIGTIGLR